MDRISVSTIQVINEKIAWLEENADADVEELKAQKKEMEDIVQPIIAKLYQVKHMFDKYVFHFIVLIHSLCLIMSTTVRYAHDCLVGSRRCSPGWRWWRGRWRVQGRALSTSNIPTSSHPLNKSLPHLKDTWPSATWGCLWSWRWSRSDKKRGSLSQRLYLQNKTLCRYDSVNLGDFKLHKDFLDPRDMCDNRTQA